MGLVRVDQIKMYYFQKAMEDKIATNFNSSVLKASAFTFKPYSIIDTKTGRHGGFEYLIAAQLAQSLNLKLLVSKPADGEWWGRETFPGSRNLTGG